MPEQQSTDEIVTVISLEKVLLTALGREWKPAGFSLETLIHDAAAEIGRLRAALREIAERNASVSGQIARKALGE